MLSSIFVEGVNLKKNTHTLILNTYRFHTVINRKITNMHEACQVKNQKE